MILFVDNYDSFTFNLVHLVAKFRRDLIVLRNDNKKIFDLIRSGFIDAVIISPGPGAPEQSGLCIEMLDILPPYVPVLGVCLGHQILALYGGNKVVRADRVMHGKVSPIYHTQESIFYKLKSPFYATRYHSLIMKEPSNHTVKIIARSDLGEPMAIKYVDRPWIGLQFHPESVLTPCGDQIIQNFLNMVSKSQRSCVLDLVMSQAS